MASSQRGSPPWQGSLRNILLLEESRGFDDRAVVGGLDKFIQRWSKAMVEHLGSSPQTGQLVEASYAAMQAEERRAWAGRWRAALAGDADGSAGESSALPSRKADNPPKSPPSPRRTGRRAGGPPPAQNVDSPVNSLRGVDAKLSSRLAKLGVQTVRDLLYLFPRRHQDFTDIRKISEMVPGQECTVVANVWSVNVSTGGAQGRRKDTEAVVGDETGNVPVVWFGQGYVARTLKPESRVALSGKPDVFRGQLVLESPEYEVLEADRTPSNAGRLTPVYPLTEGLTGRNLRRITRQALQDWLSGVDELLPQDTLDRMRLAPIRDAIQWAHYPEDWESREEARRRLAFDELLILQVAVLRRRHRVTGVVQGLPIAEHPGLVSGFLGSLPFQLTGAQERCIGEILGDLRRGTPPMNRLLQGEVGSGKTVVALTGLLAVAADGFQGAVMAPTEVLAEQHFQTVSSLLSGMARPVQSDYLVSVYLESLGRPVSVGLLTGSTRPSRKRELIEMAAAGTLDLLIGTHALIQSGVSLPRLSLAVTDEQHRFGVMQRSALRQRTTESPHVLIMSATPIPRTLTLTLYGDLDISTIDELPPGRQEVATRWLPPERRAAAYGFLRKQVEEGRQAFVICPLVDESEAVEAKAATEEYERLSRDVFPDLSLGLLHGRMASKDKDRVMRRFRDGELDILVSTAVVEVGIDVANATVMLIEGAHRFGLAQLHQFRGRVGRGAHRSYCLLLSDAPSDVAKERLSALEEIHDGFRLAEVDLELRGPGDFFGTRQSGLPNLRMAHLSDRKLLESAREEAAKIVEADPDLKGHPALAAQVARFMDAVGTEAS